MQRYDGEWKEKKGQKQTDRWSGKVMQLKRVEFHTPRLKHIYVFKKKKHDKRTSN